MEWWWRTNLGPAQQEPYSLNSEICCPKHMNYAYYEKGGRIMKRVALLLSSVGTLSLCLLTLVSLHPAHAAVRTLNTCSPTVSSSLGYVSGMAFASYLDVTAIANARV